MKFLLRFVHRVALAAAGGTVLNAIIYLLTLQYAQLSPLREPFDVLSPGLAGFWAVRSRLGRGWRIELVAGAGASFVVGIVRVVLGHYLGELPGTSELLLLARAMLAGAVGAMVSRLLRQRVVL